MICLHMMLSLLFGWDNFPAYLGKQCIDVYLTPLTFILNQSMSEGDSSNIVIGVVLGYAHYSLLFM